MYVQQPVVMVPRGQQPYRGYSGVPVQQQPMYTGTRAGTGIQQPYMQQQPYVQPYVQQQPVYAPQQQMMAPTGFGGIQFDPNAVRPIHPLFNGLAIMPPPDFGACGFSAELWGILAQAHTFIFESMLNSTRHTTLATAYRSPILTPFTLD